MIDIHSHILPQMDDGPDHWETSLEMCKIASNDGIKNIVATPHMNEVYNCDPVTIRKRVKELNQKIKGVYDIEVLAGADVYLTYDLLDRVKSGEILTINDKCYLLLELPHNFITMNVEKIVFDLRLAGILPILTHPERNWVLQNKPKIIYALVNIGLYVQITGMSLTGGFGSKAMRCAKKLLKSSLVHNIATDAHSLTARPPLLSPALNKAKRIIGENAARRLVYDIPQKIIDGEEINASDFKPAKKRWFFFSI